MKLFNINSSSSGPQIVIRLQYSQTLPVNNILKFQDIGPRHLGRDVIYGQTDINNTNYRRKNGLITRLSPGSIIA